MTEPDVIDEIAGLAPESPLWRLRRQRPDVVRHSQASYDALIRPRELGDLGLAERAAVALRVAALNGDAGLGAHYRALLAERDPDGRLTAFAGAGDAPDARLEAIQRHVDRVAAAPGTATRAHLAELERHGVGAREIVTISQLVAFVSYQARVLAGLRLLRGETA